MFYQNVAKAARFCAKPNVSHHVSYGESPVVSKTSRFKILA
jgi:hypothetical protein